LDVATRLGRYLVQELTGLKGALGAVVAVLAVVLAPALLHVVEEEGAAMRFWTLFGASNQLLAALTFLCLVVWLKQEQRPTVFALLPLGFILSITVWALGSLCVSSVKASRGLDVHAASAVVALLLLAMAASLVFAGVAAWRRARV
jgi:carbon starvation protein